MSADTGSGSPLEYRVNIPFRFSRPIEEIMSAAADLGRVSGLESDWMPSCFEDAVFEIFISSGGVESMMDLGVIPVPGEKKLPVFHLPLVLSGRPTPGDSGELRNSCPPDWPGNDLSGLVLLLSSPVPPANFGVEIVDAPKPKTGHEIMNSLRVANRARIPAG